MKVRMLHGSLNIDVIEESQNYYITPDGQALNKKAYELVPTERWVDVTTVIEAYNVVTSLPAKYYRLRKVHTCDTDYKPLAYFIVEKKGAV